MTDADYARAGYERDKSIRYRSDLFIYCIGDNATHQMADACFLLKNEQSGPFKVDFKGFKEFKETQ